MNENRITKTESLDGHVGARVPKHIEEAIREMAESEDRPIAYVVRRTLIENFGKKNV